MREYIYEGPVMRFDSVVSDTWTASTTAVSAAKAKNNLAYRFKREHNLLPNTRIDLPGKLIMVE
jgi:hypothetical protein